ncbi:NUDIX domain-containing protein [Streptomyces sp. NPDC093097]|uniref:NUDIX domain-containing protein n=1 Tax=Streptomyces sp. NPDC093097 TaxID=3366027 RepID=UPI003801932C
MTFAVNDIVLDHTRHRVGRIDAVNGDCLVLARPGHTRWDALTSWCMPATPAECQELEQREGGDGHIGVWALYRTKDGRPLLLRERDQTHQPWSLPGGYAVRNETSAETLYRTVYSTTGLTAVPGRVLAVRRVPGTDATAESRDIVYDCGTIPVNITSLRLDFTRFSAHGFIPVDQLATNALPHTAALTLSALRMLESGAEMDTVSRRPQRM